jgi:predicted MPP superfamily phosphohydrolase
VRILAHLSDLHFGRVDRAVLEPLRRQLAMLAPDLVVVSGDLTQRAKRRQFREARAFLDTLPQPQLIVPGNHDMPLYNLLARFRDPLARYRRIIASDVEPAYVDDEVAVLGINTARSLAFKGGRVSREQLERVRTVLCGVDGDRTRILVTHHPFVADDALARCDIDLLLAGHLHATDIGRAVQRASIGGRSALRVQAGTATSRRTRAEPNAFNVLRIRPRRIEVEQFTLRGGRFAPALRESFERPEREWRRVAAA